MSRRPNLSIILAVDSTGGYAQRGTIPWSFPADWKHFKSKTNNNVCVMGRGTYNDIAARRRKKTPNFRVLLPTRESFVVSSKLTNSPGDNQVQGALVVNSVDEVIHKIPKNDNRKIFLLGGFHLWTQYWWDVSEIYMTIVPGKYDTNKKFPVHWLEKEFNIVEGTKEETKHGEFIFIKYNRVRTFNETRRNKNHRRF